MNTIKSIFLSILLCVTISLKSSAQEEKKNFLFINTGMSIPIGGEQRAGTAQSSGVGTGTFADSWNAGFNLGAGFEYSFVEALSVVVDFDFNNFPLDKENYMDGSSGTADGGTLSIVMFSANLKAFLTHNPGSANPYLTGGLGTISFSNYEITASGPGFSEIRQVTFKGGIQDAALLLGGDLDISAGKTATVFLEGKIAIGLFAQATYIPLKAGVRFGF